MNGHFGPRFFVPRFIIEVCPRKSESFVATSLFFPILHPQTTRTRQPAARNCLFTRASRWMFFVILFLQNTTFDKGGRPRGHLWPCQKQPWMKMTMRLVGNTISGVPGKSFLWILKRYPRV